MQRNTEDHVCTWSAEIGLAKKSLRWVEYFKSVINVKFSWSPQEIIIHSSKVVPLRYSDSEEPAIEKSGMERQADHKT